MTLDEEFDLIARFLGGHAGALRFRLQAGGGRDLRPIQERIGCSGLHLGRRRRLQGDERRTNELPLKTVARGERLGDPRFRRGRGICVDKLVHFGVIRFTSKGNERNQTDATSNVAAGVVELAQLPDKI